MRAESGGTIGVVPEQADTKPNTRLSIITPETWRGIRNDPGLKIAFVTFTLVLIDYILTQTGIIK